VIGDLSLGEWYLAIVYRVRDGRRAGLLDYEARALMLEGLCHHLDPGGCPGRGNPKVRTIMAMVEGVLKGGVAS
jgi:hypothetical protein